MGILTGEATGFQENQGKIASPEYPSVLTQQPPVQYGERTGFQAIITSSWVLRWAAMPTTYAHYRQIRKHPTVALARILCAAPVLAAEWSVKAHDGANPEWVRLIQDTFMPMRERFLEPALLFGNIDFGYQGFEKVFDQADGYDKLVKLKPLLQDITEICIGHRGELLGFRQWGTELGLANALHVGFRIEGSYLYGIPLLENIRETHRDWVECNEGAKRYDKHVAGAHWIVHYPDILVTHNGVKNVPAGVVAREILNTLESAGGAAVPRDVAAFMQQLGTNDPGWLIELKATGTQEQAGFVDRLNYLDKLLCRGLLLPERSVLEGTHGTKEEAETHLDAAMVTKDLEHRYCTAELNRQAVDEVLVLNFGPEAKGQVELEAAPIVDSKREFFKDLYMQVLANPQAAVAEFNKMDFDAIRDALGIPKAKETDKPNIPEPYGMEPYGQNGREEIPPEGDDRGGYGGYGGNGDGGNSGGPGPQSLLMANRTRTLELAGSEPVEQEPWVENPRFLAGSMGYKTKLAPLGGDDYLHFEAMEDREGNNREGSGGDDAALHDIAEENGLSHPHEVLWGRGPKSTTGSAHGRFGVTGEGKAGLVLSHAAHALHELVRRYRPVSVEFSGREPSREKAYLHMMRRLAGDRIGNGEYVLFHEPGDSFRVRGGRTVHEPAYFHIVHKSAADLPRYQQMEIITPRQKVAMANEGEPRPKLSTDTPPVEYWKPTAPSPPEFHGEELHQKIANLYNNAIHKAPPELRAQVAGNPPENFLADMPKHAHTIIKTVGSRMGKQGNWMWPEDRNELIQTIPGEMIHRSEFSAPKTMKKGIGDLKSYDPKIHGSFPDYFNAVRSRTIAGLVEKRINEQMNVPRGYRRNRGKGGGIVERKRKEPQPPRHTSDEYPDYEPDELDRQMHAAIETHFNPTFAPGVKFVYDMLRSGKHYGWGVGNENLGGSGQHVPDTQRVNRYAAKLAGIGDQLAKETGNGEFSKRARITPEGIAAGRAAAKAAIKPYFFMHDQDKPVYGQKLTKFIEGRVKEGKLEPGAIAAVRGLLAGRSPHELRNDKNVASNNVKGFRLIRQLRELQPEFWESVKRPEYAKQWRVRLEAEKNRGHGLPKMEYVPPRTAQIEPGGGRKPLTREQVIKIVGQEGHWNTPRMEDLLDHVETHVGGNAVEMLDTIARNGTEDDLLNIYGRKKVGLPQATQNLGKAKSVVANVLRKRLGRGTPEERALLKFFEVMLDTPEGRRNPIYMSNVKRLRKFCQAGA